MEKIQDLSLKIQYHLQLAFLAAIAYVLAPIKAHAQIMVTPGTCADLGSITSLKTLLDSFTCLLVFSLVPLLVSAALVAFIYGLVVYITNAENEAKREEGKKYILWGFLSLFLIVSIWQIVKILRNTLGIEGGIFVPQLPQGE